MSVAQQGEYNELSLGLSEKRIETMGWFLGIDTLLGREGGKNISDQRHTTGKEERQ